MIGAKLSENRATLRVVHTFFITAVTIAGCMFLFKLFAFLKTIKKDELVGFAFDPIITYGLVAMGFLFLLAWAYLSGQFRNIEQPKYDMLRRFDEQVRAEEAQARLAGEATGEEADRG